MAVGGFSPDGAEERFLAVPATAGKLEMTVS